MAVVEPEPSDARTLYLGLDGTGVPVRKAETAGRKGKQPDGSARTREAKIVAVWSAETLDRDGRPAREAGRRCFASAPRRVVLGDGAAWIWNWADEPYSLNPTANA